MTEPRICGHCGREMRGYADLGGTWLCHPDDDLDCYRLVTVYHHEMPCFQCASIHYDEPEMRHVSWSEAREAMRQAVGLTEAEWEKTLAAARVRYRSEIRKYRGIDRLRAMYRRRKR